MSVRTIENNNETVNNEVGFISLNRFREEMGIVPSTAWRWIQRGWLDQPINIGGRQYLTKDGIRRFKERARRANLPAGAICGYLWLRISIRPFPASPQRHGNLDIAKSETGALRMKFNGARSVSKSVTLFCNPMTKFGSSGEYA